MSFLIYGGSILVGFVLGYFLAKPMVMIISLICVSLAIGMRPRKEQELAALIGVIAWIVLSITMVMMWATHLYVTGFSFSGMGIPNIAHYFLRQ